jgi:hypothetical protein
MIMTIINKTRKIDAIVAPAVLQESVELTHLTPPPQPTQKITQIITGFGTLNKSIGPRLQKIDPVNFQILKVYEYVGEAITESNNQLKRPSVDKAVVEGTIYRNFRWAYVPREKDPNVLHDLLPTREVKVQNTGYIAKLNATKTEILNVYLDKKTACFDNGYTSSSGIDIAVKNKTLTRNHFYALFRECDPNLQETFLTRYCEGDADKLLLYKDGVGCSARAGRWCASMRVSLTA